MAAANISEARIEKYLCDEVKKIGGRPRKYRTPARPAAPDRIILFPGGVAVFVECKRPYEIPTKAQARELSELERLGFKALWVNSYETVDEVIRLISEHLTINEVHSHA
jgi:hypothetical protein